jgi:hypothetical protein
VLWALAAPVFLAAGLVTAARQGRSPVVAALAAGTGLVLAALAGLLAIGLRARAGWARYLQIVAAGLGLLICPFTFASATVLVYLLRPDVRAAFDGTSSGAAEGAGDAELTFALSLFGMLALGLILTAVAVLLRGGP